MQCCSYTLGLINKRNFYRVTEQLVQNTPLSSKQKFRFGLARPGQARLKRNYCFEFNGRFCTSCSVTLYALLMKKITIIF